MEVLEHRLVRVHLSPWFAEELTPAASADPFDHSSCATAASWGARCVSLAGMIPSLTGYGFGVLNHPDMVGDPALTTWSRNNGCARGEDDHGGAHGGQP